MGGAGDPPAPVGDPPTGTPASNVAPSAIVVPNSKKGQQGRRVTD